MAWWDEERGAWKGEDAVVPFQLNEALDRNPLRVGTVFTTKGTNGHLLAVAKERFPGARLEVVANVKDPTPEETPGEVV